MNKRNLFIVIFSVLILASSQVYAISCIDDIQSKNTKDFMNEISTLNGKVQSGSCDSSVSFFSEDALNVQIFMQSGSTESFMVTTKDGKITEIKIGSSNNPSYILGTGECEFDTILRSNNRMGVASYIYMQKKIQFYMQKKIQFTAVSFFKKIKLGITKLFIGVVLGRFQTPADIACSTATGEAQGLKKVGEVCQHGGQCETGNCVGVGQGPPWTYECSCDPFKFVAADTDGNCPKTPQYPESGKGKVGDICQHGGQCETGNCVGVGQGPPWTYKCSCNAFRYETNC